MVSLLAINLVITLSFTYLNPTTLAYTVVVKANYTPIIIGMTLLIFLFFCNFQNFVLYFIILNSIADGLKK